MRATTAPELAILAASTRQITQRLKVANGSGTMIDLTSWVEEVTRNEDIDRPVAALSVHFRRDSGTTLSLAPFRTDSTLNRLDDGTTYSPQLDAGRSVTWEVATTPIGTAPVAGDYKLRFKGTIDSVDFDHSPVVVECRDLGSVLVDRGIEVEAAYGSTGGVALQTVMQQNLDAVFGSGFIPLYTPVSPSYLISPAYIQQRQSEMDAQQALAQLPGWDVRYWWDSATSAFRFTLQQPPRTKTTPDYTFGPSAYLDLVNLSIVRTDIRNVIAVSYFDTAAGNRQVITVSDATSITKYGRRYFFIQEADNSPINTSTEATAMANAALSDMKDPKAEAEIELPLFWPAELWDLYRFSANGVHINSNQDWAVVSVSDKLTRNSHRTTLTVRGNPAGGYLTWRDRDGISGGTDRPGEVGPEAHIEVFGPPSGLTVQLLYTGTGGTAPLSYQRRIDVDGVSTGTYSAVAALGSGVTEWITVQPYAATRIFLRVIDATGLEGNADPFFLQGDFGAIDKVTGLASFSSLTGRPTTVGGYGITDTYTKTAADARYAPTIHLHAFSDLTSTPTTLAGYGITDAASSSHTHTFASLTSKPTTISGYGITDFNSLGDARWAALSHTHAATDITSGLLNDARLSSNIVRLNASVNVNNFTNPLLVASDPVMMSAYADAHYATISHTHSFASLTAKPTTLAGYGITDAAAAGHTHTFASLTSKPTTLLGYGITDAPTTDGSGATGTWPISITGSAASLGGIAAAKYIGEQVSNISTSGQADAARQQQTFAYTGSGTPVNGGFISFGGFAGAYDTQIIGRYSSSDYLGYRTRNGDTNTWNAWREIITDNRIGSFAPTLTGGGASGTWGISISGTAANASLLSGYAVNEAASNSTIVARTASGYIFSNYINTTDDTSSSLGAMVGKIGGGDNYHRTYNAASVRTFIGVGTSNQNLNQGDNVIFNNVDLTGAIRQKKGTSTYYDTPTYTVSSSAAPGSSSGYPTGHLWIQVTAPV